MPKYVWETPTEINKALAERVKRIRKRKGMSRKLLSDRSNVSYASLRRFEETGEISLSSLTKLAVELGLADEIRNLFSNPAYSDISEVLRDGR